MAITPEKAEKIAQAYCYNGYVKSEALITVGYSPSYATCGLSGKIYDNILVKNAIAKVEAEIKAKAEEEGITATELTRRYNEIEDKAKQKGDFVNALRANENLSKHIGYYEADNQAKRPQIAILNAPESRLEQLEEERRLIVESQEAGLAVDEG